jgi:RimJ/RimL family protein N-acetyltransferase
MGSVLLAVRGDTVDLESLERRHLPMTRLWRNLPRIRRWFGHSAPITPEAHMEWYRRYLSNPGDFFFVITQVRPRRRPVGTVSVYDVDRRARTAQFGRLLVGVAAASGRGLAKGASRAAISFAFEVLGLRRLWLEVRKDNVRAIGLYRSLGFRKSRTRRGMVLMEILA